MKLYGSVTELVSAVFRKNSNTITLRPNQATTYTGARDIQTPAQDANSVLISTDSTDTLTNKTLTSPKINENVALTTTATKLNFLTSAVGTTGTASTNIVFSTSPSLTTPSLGVATATSINKVAFTTPATGSTLTIADGKTLTASNTLTFTGTDGSSVAFGTGGTAAYTGGTLAQFSATTSAQLAGVISDETGTGALVFATNPILVTPALGTPSSGTLTSCTGLPLSTGVTGQLATTNGGTGQNSTATFPTSGVVVTEAATETLTNKTLTAPILSSFADYTEIATPATPGAGVLRVYSKSGDGLYIKNSAGTESQLSTTALATPTVTGTITSYFGVIQSAVSILTNASATSTTADGFLLYAFSTGNTNRTLTLPAASANTGRRLHVKKTDSGTGLVTVTRAGSDTIDGATTYVLTSQYDAVLLVCDGTTWNVQEGALSTTTLNGLVSTGTQTLAGAKTWNDVQTFKYSSGGSTAGSYDTNGSWSLTCGAGNNLTLKKASGASISIWPDATGSSNTYSFDNSSGTFRLLNHAGTGVLGTCTQVGLWTLGDTSLIGGATAKGTNIVGRQDQTSTTSAVAAGYVGEYIERNVTSGTSLTSGTITEVDSTGITLTPGVWDIQISAHFIPQATTTVTTMQSWVGTATGNVTTGRDLNRNFVALFYSNGGTTVLGNNDPILMTPVYRVAINASTQYYLKASAVFGVSTMTVQGLIRATRVA